MANPSSRGTGNEPVEGIDPGGTRPTKPGNPDKSGGATTGKPKAGEKAGDQPEQE